MIRYIRENDEQIIEMPLKCIKGATLLSEEEFEKYKDNISPINDFWWLSSPGIRYYYACYVYRDGDVPSNYYVDGTDFGIRPVLILNLKSLNLRIGDKFQFGGIYFTILSNDLAICDDIIGKGCFREDYNASNANVYEKSDVKKVVDNWFNKTYSNEDSMIEIIKSDQSFFKDDDWGF